MMNQQTNPGRSRRTSHNRVAACLLMLLAFLVLPGCAGGIRIATRTYSLEADDGFPLRCYQNFQWSGTGRKYAQPGGVLFYAQGSDDRSVLDQTGNFAGACAMGLDVVCAERRGVHPDGTVDHAVAARYATRDRRVEDLRRLIDAYLDEHPDISPVILMGGSEGADIASTVAAREPRITHVVLIGGGGGWSQADEFLHMARTRPGSIPGVRTDSDLQARFDDIRANPDSDAQWFGHTYRRWASYLFRAPVEDLLRVEAPILAVHGDRDHSVPVESARALRDAFARAGKNNLTYREYAGVDHSFTQVDTGKNVRAWLEADIVCWLAEDGVLEQRRADVYLKRIRRAHPEWSALPNSAAAPNQPGELRPEN